MQDPTEKHARDVDILDKYNYKKQIKRYNVVSEDTENILQWITLKNENTKSLKIAR